MKIIKSNVEILGQGPGIIGMKKHIERCARISYKSEDRITEDSYIKFVGMLIDRGHWACLEFGSVYLIIPSLSNNSSNIFFINLFSTSDHNRIEYVGTDAYITTNYRFILQNNLEEIMEKYWVEPTQHHYHRVTSHWICSRSTSHQIVRSRVYSYIQESQRYVNYSKDKFGSEITIILPQWIYDVRKEVGSTIDPQTYEPRDYILSYDGEELVKELACWDRTVASRYDFWKYCEKEYLYETTTDEGETLNPEDARGVLCNDVKTELCMCGFLDDWFYVPKSDTTEKAGFFYLRSANSAQRDIRVLSQSLENQMRELGLDKLK